MKFSLGQVVATPGALEALAEAGQTPEFFLGEARRRELGRRRRRGRQANDRALVNGSRICRPTGR